MSDAQSRTTASPSPAATKLVVRLRDRATRTLAPLHREMRVMGWAPEYRAIMWETVAMEALALAREASSGKQS